MISTGRYLAAETVGDIWICYPWEAMYFPLHLLQYTCTDTVLGISMNTTNWLLLSNPLKVPASLELLWIVH
jgi:hypothetical protein